MTAETRSGVHPEGFTLKFSLKGVKRVHPEGFTQKGSPRRVHPEGFTQKGSP